MDDRQPMNVLVDGSVILQHCESGDQVLSIAASGNNQLLSTGGQFGRVYIWDFINGKILHTFNPSGEDGLYGIFETGFHISLPYFAYINPEGILVVARTDSWNEILTLGQPEANTLTFAFSNLFGWIAFGCQSGQISVWDLQTNREILSYITPPDPYVLSFSPNSEVLSIVCCDGTIHFVQIRSGKLLHELPIGREQLAWGIYSPYQPLILTISEHGMFSTTDIATFQTLSQVSLPLSDVAQCSASPTTPSFAARSSNGLITVLNYFNKSFTTILTPPKNINPICYSFDGASLLIGIDQFVRKIPLVTIEHDHTLPGIADT